MYKNIAHEDPRPGFSIFNDRGNAEEAQQRKRRQVEYVPDAKAQWQQRLERAQTEGCSKGAAKGHGKSEKRVWFARFGTLAQHGGRAA